MGSINDSRDPAIMVDGLVKRYGDLAAVDGSRSTSSPARSSASSGPTAPASRRRSRCCARSPTRPPARRRSPATTSSPNDSTSAATSGWCSRTRRSTCTSRRRRTCASTPSCTACRRRRRPSGCAVVLEMVGLWERRDGRVQTVLRRHAAAPGDRSWPDALAAGALPRRADGRARPADAVEHLDLHRRAAPAGGHHDLPHDALHGRGRELRPHRDHGRRQGRRARHARAAQGQRRHRPRADRHRRRRGGDRGDRRPSSASPPRCTTAW